ncbi:flagellar type III secretion system protein FliR [Crassaminicella thermophila]|uniref:Flagellar biosynthetic protein FliR n=1 Tax=Crassaminicella thermophila TaxID=2599308 RepID=A0A5C0SDT2_CRATE|nr:flagellar biosynthetic protein FliR [Crassaminicella thermophila]QEK12260.1 flagellar type III secretion system protein FliR [Crassaminicella thermophila]
MEIISQLYNNVDVFILVFARIIGIFISAPFFNHKNIPIFIKIGFSLIFAIILFPVIKIQADLVNNNFYLLLLTSMKELLTGILIGFVCYLFFSLIYLTGSIVDMQIGFTMATVMNPQDNTQVPITGSMFYIMAMLVFLSINGHHTLIYALKYSFNNIALGSLSMNMLMVKKLIEILITTFNIAFKMSAPILISVFITNILLGILARTMPQMNVFVVGMPLKIGVGLMIIILVLPLYVSIFQNIFNDMIQNLYEFVNFMAKG